MNKAFEGLRVADFSWQVVGPMVGSCMAAFGAEVIKIESRTRYCTGRTMGPFVDGIPTPDRSVKYVIHNTGRLGVTLNLNQVRGIEIAKKIVQSADIVIESFAGGRMAKWGLGYEDLKKIKPDIIMMSMAGYGQTGPFAQRPGFGGTFTAASGAMHLTGLRDEPPRQPCFVFTDYVVYRIAILALVAAIDYRRRTGKGQYIDLSQLEAVEHFFAPLFLDYEVNGRDSIRNANKCNYAAPHGVYRCKGAHRYCCITVFTEQEWDSFCQVIGEPAWVNSPDFDTFLGRLKNADELDRLVEEWTIEHGAEEIMDLLQSAGVPSGVVQNAEDLDKDPQLASDNFYFDLDHPEQRTVFLKGWPVKLSKTPYEVKRPHGWGENNFDVYTGLGLSDQDFLNLLDEGVFE